MRRYRAASFLKSDDIAMTTQTTLANVLGSVKVSPTYDLGTLRVGNDSDRPFVFKTLEPICSCEKAQEDLWSLTSF
jgi:hypothetical protein